METFKAEVIILSPTRLPPLALLSLLLHTILLMITYLIVTISNISNISKIIPDMKTRDSDAPERTICSCSVVGGSCLSRAATARLEQYGVTLPAVKYKVTELYRLVTL